MPAYLLPFLPLVLTFGTALASLSVSALIHGTR
jgi:hypothetical protein